MRLYLHSTRRWPSRRGRQHGAPSRGADSGIEFLAGGDGASASSADESRRQSRHDGTKSALRGAAARPAAYLEDERRAMMRRREPPREFQVVAIFSRACLCFLRRSHRARRVTSLYLRCAVRRVRGLRQRLLERRFQSALFTLPFRVYA